MPIARSTTVEQVERAIGMLAIARQAT